MRKRSGQVHSRESSATLQLTVSLLYQCYVHKLTENNIRDTISLTIAQTLKQERRRQYEKEIS